MPDSLGIPFSSTIFCRIGWALRRLRAKGLFQRLVDRATRDFRPTSLAKRKLSHDVYSNVHATIVDNSVPSEELLDPFCIVFLPQGAAR